MAKFLDQTGVTTLMTGINNTYAKKTDLSAYETATEAGAKYATQTTVNTLSNEVNDLKSSLGSVYKYKGSVANLAALNNLENVKSGDVYNLEDTGMNVAAIVTGEEGQEVITWDDLGSSLSVSVEALSTAEINEIINGTVNPE